MPPQVFLKDILPHNGFIWPWGTAILGRGQRDAAVAEAVRAVVRFRRADVEPLFAAVFARAASRVAARRPEDENFVDFVDSLHRETAWARVLAFSLFFDLFCAVRDARHRHRADTFGTAGPARHQLGALATAVDGFLDAAGDRWASATSATDGEERPLGGIDEELLLLAGSNDNAPAPDEEEGAMDAEDAVTEPRGPYDAAGDRRLAGSVAGLIMAARAPEDEEEDEKDADAMDLDE